MEKSINFNNEKINKKTFYNNKKQFDIQQIDTNKILISEPEPYGKKNVIKYIIGYNDNVIRPLRILLPKMIGYIKYFDDDKKTMSFVVVDDAELLIKYTEIWNKIRDLINKKFDSEPVYNNKYINTKVKLCNNNIKTSFHDENNIREVPKENCAYKCLSLISLDSVVQTSKKYYPQTILEECKYKLTNKRVKNLIISNFDSSSKSDTESDNNMI